MGTMDAAEAREIAQCMSDEEDQQRQAARFHAPGGENAESWALQSVASVLQRVQEAPGDEVSVEVLARQLEQLPREAKANQLMRLLIETREESIPKQAVPRGPKGTGQKTRSKSAANIPIIRSRLLESKRKQAECDLKLLQNRITLLQVMLAKNICDTESKCVLKFLGRGQHGG
ncbi:Zz type zinc finger domain containing protein [Phytophthora palmivora]|uniref:Zz type zinc finger domain containing protein n=1 Tax=Phytophthora palmivora TaxID=4796 RepID=A0A2P4XIB4_9STRA|nr:Zz type zinc finger domain containing protein [Phytophthora palmivora]